MLKVRSLSVLRRAEEELVNINLEVARGECLVVVGPNSSGKSLLVRTIATAESDYSGDIMINHYHAKTESAKAQLHLGYLSSNLVPEPHLTGLEYLEMVGAFYGLSPKIRLERILILAERFACKDYLYTLNERLGKAFHQRIGIIASLLHQPDVLIWDEPIVFLDESARVAAITLLQEHLKRGGTVLVSTNDLELAELIGDQILIMQEGQVVAQGTLNQLCNQFKPEHKSLRDIYHHLFP